MAVDFELAEHVARIYLNRPHRLNAVVPELADGLVTALARAGQEGARVVVLAGRGRAFCSGHDLKEQLAPETVLATRLRVGQIQEVTRAIRRFPGPVIAAVHGYALGAGCEFALGSDLVIAAEDAQFGFPEVSVGLSVTGGISRLLPLLVGPVRAKELLLLGERFGAARALELGPVNRVVPAGQHEQEADEIAARLGDQPTLALASGRVYHTGRIKDMIRRSGENIAARQVEEVLLTHRAVRLAAVIAVPDEIRGEEAMAYHVPEGDSGGDTGPGALAGYCRVRLAAFKVPRYWQPAGDLPRADSQRVAKAQLGDISGSVFDALTGRWGTT